MKKKLVFFVCLAMAVMAAGCGAKKDVQEKVETAADASGKEQNTSDSQTAVEEPAQSQEAESGGLLSGKHYVDIHIKDKGVIRVELDADSAPISVTNFVNLAKSGFYDGLTFHRIIDGFMMQGGDPQGTGAGGSDESIKGEFSNNGVENTLSHTRGPISMARSQLPDSARSQFFIVHRDSTFLDGEYAAFGYVTEGIEIVDDICENTTGQDANGVVPEENRPVIEKMEYLGQSNTPQQADGASSL